jgi:hypothetical protein
LIEDNSITEWIDDAAQTVLISNGFIPQDITQAALQFTVRRPYRAQVQIGQGQETIA